MRPIMKNKTYIFRLIAFQVWLLILIVLTGSRDEISAQQKNTTFDVTLTWDANSEPDLAGYIVYWGTEGPMTRKYTAKSGLITDTTYKITGLEYGQMYYFAVTARDTENLESDFSNEVSTDGYKGVPPKMPTGLAGGNALTVKDITIHYADGTSITIAVERDANIEK